MASKLAICIFVVYWYCTQLFCASFPAPSWESSWQVVKAQDSSKSSLQVTHGLGELPALVRVLVKAVSGPNVGYVFEGTGVPQRDDDSNTKYGAVVYIYNDKIVKILAPKWNNKYRTGRVICVGAPAYSSGGGWDACGETEKEALVKVKVWLSGDMPPTSFHTSWLAIKSKAGTESYQEVLHNIGSIPDLLTVQVYGGPSPKYIYEAAGASQSDSGGNILASGTVFGYNETVVRLWTPHVGNQVSLFDASDGWGGSSIRFGQAAKYRILAWKKLSTTTFQKTTASATDSLSGCFHGGFVSVKTKATDGPNAGFVFHGLGSTQNQNIPSSTFGGVLFGYSNTYMQLFRPVSSNGYLINIGDGWGNGINTQKSNNGEYIIQVWHSGVLPDSCKGPMTNPAFESSWMDTSSWSSNNATVKHNLGETPTFVKVLAQITSGVNQGFIFEGTSFPYQAKPGKPLGHVYYYYDAVAVTVSLPSNRINGTVGSVCIGHPGYSDGCGWSQCPVDVMIKVQAWSPAQTGAPNFRKTYTVAKDEEFIEIPHESDKPPHFVHVKLFHATRGIYLDGMGASNDKPASPGTAVLVYAYNPNNVRVWLSSVKSGPVVCEIELQSCGRDDPQLIAYVKLNRVTVLDNRSIQRGLNMVIISPACTVKTAHKFDVYGSTADSDRLTQLISDLPQGTVFAGVTRDDASKKLGNDAKSALNSEGITMVNNLAFRSSLAFIAKKGDPSFARQNEAAQASGPCTLTETVTIEATEELTLIISLWTNLVSPVFHTTQTLSDKPFLNFTAIDLEKQFVIVSTKANGGPNSGYIFHGTGSVLNMGQKASQFGGVVYGYSDSSIRLFLPAGAGTLINIGDSEWGGGSKKQHTNNAQILITVYQRTQNVAANMTTNLAYLQPAYQSSTYSNNPAFGAGKAVDGNSNPILGRGSCFHTRREQLLWWLADLGDRFYITSVILTNRADKNGKRLKDFKISVGNAFSSSGFDPKSYTECYSYSGAASDGEVITAPCSGHVPSRYVTIWMDGVNNYLHLCEVEVYGLNEYMPNVTSTSDIECDITTSTVTTTPTTTTTTTTTIPSSTTSSTITTVTPTTTMTLATSTLPTITSTTSPAMTSSTTMKMTTTSPVMTSSTTMKMTTTSPVTSPTTMKTTTTSAYPTTTRKSKWFRRDYTDEEIENWFNPIVVILPVSIGTIPVIVFFVCFWRTIINFVQERCRKKKATDDVIELDTLPLPTPQSEAMTSASQHFGTTPDSVCHQSAETSRAESMEPGREMSPFPIYMP